MTRFYKIFLFLVASALLLAMSTSSQVNWKYRRGGVIRVVTSSGGGGSANLALQGFGINAAGADVGDPIITVSSLGTGTGAGTLYNALFTATGGTGSATSHKTIKFSVDGTISRAFFVNNNDHITIDGTGHNIVITGNDDGMSFEGNGAHHIIVKNLHFADCTGDGANVVDNSVTGAHDIAFMNCSFYGNGDGNIDVGVTTGTDANVTIQYCIIGYHTAPIDDGAGGMLITSTNVSCHHNLFNVKSDEEGERCPLVHGNYSNAFADVRNNLVYNFGRDQATGSGYGTADLFGVSGAGGYARANIVNNYYYTPSSDAASDGVWVDGGSGVPAGEAYSAGNVSGNGFNFNTGSYTNHAEWSITSTFQIQSETACQSVAYILANVGPDTKNSVDNALIAEITQLGSCAFAPTIQKIRYWYLGDHSEVKDYSVSDVINTNTQPEFVLPRREMNKRFKKIYV
jgi:hypothetical protein